MSDLKLNIYRYGAFGWRVEVDFSAEIKNAFWGSVKTEPMSHNSGESADRQPEPAELPFEVPESLPGRAGIAVRLRAIRLYRDYSQLEISKIIGISNDAISNAELGKSMPRKSTLRKLAGALNCSTTWLIGGRGDYRRKGYKKQSL